MKNFPALAPFKIRWNALNQRQKTWLRAAVILLGLILLWSVLIAPALRTLRQAEAQQRGLDVQLQKMQGLQAEAQALQSQRKISYEDARRALDASVAHYFGASAQLNVVGERASMTLRNAPADELSLWLAQARVEARAIPSEARLTRSAANPAGPPTWDGTLVLSLPPQ